MPIADELIKNEWKRLNLPPPSTPGAAPAAGDGGEMLLAGFALPCPSDQTWMLHRNVSSLCNLHKSHPCAPPGGPGSTFEDVGLSVSKLPPGAGGNDARKLS